MQGLFYLLDRIGNELAQHELHDQEMAAELNKLRAQLAQTRHLGEHTEQGGER